MIPSLFAWPMEDSLELNVFMKTISVVIMTKLTENRRGVSINNDSLVTISSLLFILFYQRQQK
ncbi:hypothetical protein DERF_011477 [Dermatophagoides farinae]|uniref:Uncharacterized protein n=1 Tax=Dermatophagoides farinae TaxID=6954 RepID=A0A922HT07_DERFA|nr:hypothetical protein DERF_011477 [Dermatophagoides farinae]